MFGCADGADAGSLHGACGGVGGMCPLATAPADRTAIRIQSGFMKSGL
jgi:hypothetical protein